MEMNRMKNNFIKYSIVICQYGAERRSRDKKVIGNIYDAFLKRQQVVSLAWRYT